MTLNEKQQELYENLIKAINEECDDTGAVKVIAAVDSLLDEIGAIEEKLGCPLEVREKAFDNGFYDVNGNHYFCEHYVPYLKAMHTRGIMNGTSKKFKLKDYKKTWWLKDDRSE